MNHTCRAIVVIIVITLNYFVIYIQLIMHDPNFDIL